MVLEGVSNAGIDVDQALNVVRKLIDTVDGVLELLGEVLVKLVHVVVFQSGDALKGCSEVIYKVLEAGDGGSRAASCAILKVGTIREVGTRLGGFESSDVEDI